MTSMAIATTTTTEASAIKVTAEQIKSVKDCPEEVERLGNRISAHLHKVHNYEANARKKVCVDLRKADDHWNTVTQLLAEAKVMCSADGFEAFKERFCPDLSRSRIYELLQIGSGKKTLEESRAAKRARVAKSRGKKVSATNGVADEPTVEPPPVPIETANGAEPETKPALAAPEDIEVGAEPNGIAAKASQRALEEFKVACNYWFLKTVSDDRRAAIAYFCEVAGLPAIEGAA